MWVCHMLCEPVSVLTYVCVGICMGPTMYLIWAYVAICIHGHTVAGVGGPSGPRGIHA